MTAVQDTTHATSVAPVRRAGFYPRVSRVNGRDAEALERHTIAQQLAYAERILPRGVELVVDERYKDVNVSGRTKQAERPGLSALFDDLRAGVLTDVVVGYLSRFGRNTAELMLNVQELETLNATLYVGGDHPMIITPGVRGTAKMLLQILAAVAEMQADQLEDGLKMANETALASGVSIQIPYGYRRSDGAGSALEPDEDDDGLAIMAPASVVRLIYARRLAGVGSSEIASELNRIGVPTPTEMRHLRGESKREGAPLWRHNTVANIVATRTYKGVIPKAIKWRGEGKRKVPIAWEELPGAHAPLVSEDDWKAAQLNRVRAIRNGSNGNALLRGFVRCAGCSRTMRPSRSKSTLTYICPNKDCPSRARIARYLVDDYVTDRLWHETNPDRDPDVYESGKTREQEHEDAVALVEQMREEYDRFVSRAGALPDDVFARGNAEHLQRLGDAQAALHALEAKREPYVQDIARNFDSYPLDAQRAALDALIDAVVVKRAPARGKSGDIAERVLIVPKGAAPFALSGTGRIVESRPWPFDHHELN